MRAWPANFVVFLPVRGTAPDSELGIEGYLGLKAIGYVCAREAGCEAALGASCAFLGLG